MKRISLLLIVSASFAANAFAGELSRHEFAYGDTVRTYGIYLPENAAPGMPLIVYTHGYGTKPANRVRADLNEASEKYGYAICYPDGSPDARGKDGWNVGYPSQAGMDVDEADFFGSLLDEVCEKFNLSRDNVFLTGMSNGGDLCYQLAYTHPELFKAYASVAGLTFENVYMAHSLTAAIPFMEIHGTADKTSMWLGDHNNTGGWGAYIPVPLAVSAIAANNRCTTMATDTVPSNPGSERIVTRTVYSGSPAGKEVILYCIDGGAHRWGNADIPTGDIICRFFNHYRK